MKKAHPSDSFSDHKIHLVAKHPILKGSISIESNRTSDRLLHVRGAVTVSIKGLGTKIVNYRTEAVWERAFAYGLPFENDHATAEEESVWRLVSVSDSDLMRGVRHEWLFGDTPSEIICVRRKDGVETGREKVSIEAPAQGGEPPLLDPASLLLQLAQDTANSAAMTTQYRTLSVGGPIDIDVARVTHIDDGEADWQLAETERLLKISKASRVITLDTNTPTLVVKIDENVRRLTGLKVLLPKALLAIHSILFLEKDAIG